MPDLELGADVDMAACLELSAAHGFGFLFWTLIIASLVIAAALFGVAPAIKRMLGEAKPPTPAADDSSVLPEKAVEL